MHTSMSKKPIQKVYILNDSKYMIFGKCKTMKRVKISVVGEMIKQGTEDI